jgi:hypothetical protein
MNRKVSEEDVCSLQLEFARGAPVAELAVAFELSERHVRRLCAGLERRLPHVDPGESVEAAMQRFLDDLELDAPSRVTASAALLVARRLDHADARSTPALVERLVGLCQQLAIRNREPDRVDELVARREARRLQDQVEARRTESH